MFELSYIAKTIEAVMEYFQVYIINNCVHRCSSYIEADVSLGSVYSYLRSKNCTMGLTLDYDFKLTNVV